MLTQDNAEYILQISSDAQREKKPFDFACEKLLDHTNIFKWANECNRRDYAGRSQLKVAHVSNDYEPARKIVYTNQAQSGQHLHKKGPSLRYENDLWNSISPEDKALLVEIRKHAHQNLEHPQQVSQIPITQRKSQASIRRRRQTLPTTQT
jgi:hypothetical protein